MSGEAWNLIRIGIVSACDYARARVKCDFEELEITSDWLPVVQRGAGGARDYWMPAIGESVVCIYYSDGTEEGVVIGSYYPAGSPPPDGGGGIFYTVYPDGSSVTWDGGDLSINATGAIAIEAAAGVTITGDTTIDGDLEVTGDINVTGKVYADDFVNT